MLRRLIAPTPLLVAFALSAHAQAGGAAAGRPSYAEPAVSPDAREIAFASGGDLWSVPAGGGEARLLVSHPATESRPIFSPDGRRIAFASSRSGGGDVYVLDFASGETRRLTWNDAADLPDAWSADGRHLFFSSTGRDIAGMNDVFRVAVDGGTPVPVAGERYVNEFWAAPSPDGATLAITARGIASGQWWRRGGSHIDESEIWLVRGVGTPAARTERFGDGTGRERWPMWSPDGGTVYFVSDRGGAPNVWSRAATGGAPRQLTRFREGRVLWPSLSRNGRLLAWERAGEIHALDVASGQSRVVPITRRGAPAGPGPERVAFSTGWDELALAPDGRKIALIGRGEVWAAASRDGGDAVRVTDTPAAEMQPVWAPDSRRLAYLSLRDGAPQLFVYDFATRAEVRLTTDAEGAASPRFSPDGRQLAYVRGGREVRVLDLATRADRRVATGILDRAPITPDRALVWSPDGRWIAFSAAGERLFRNLHIVPADGSQPARAATSLANSFSNTVSWSPDGTYLLWDTGQRTESAGLARVDLVPRVPRFREDQFRDLFQQQNPRQPGSPERPADQVPRTATRDSAAPFAADSGRARTGGARIEWDGIRRRLSLLPTGVDVGYQAISPDGKTVVLIAGAEGQQNLYTYPLDDLAREEPVARQLTSTGAPKGDAQWSPDGKEIFYLEGGRVQVVALDTRTPRTVAVSAEMESDFAREKTAVFEQTWRYLRDHFYDPAFHGVNWDQARAEYAPLIAGARTPDEMRRILNLMVGELDASHLGVNAPPSASSAPSTGQIGVRWDAAEYLRTGRLRIAEIIPLGPVAVAGGIRVGDYLLAVDGRPADARTSADALLAYRIGRQTTLSVAASPDGPRRDVAVRPVNLATEKGLLYRAWVESNREYVARRSGGRLGYVHMFDMGAASLQQLHVDLDAENQGREGVVIDVRNNNGGFVNAYAIDVFARRPYLVMTPRGGGTAPARSQLGQRALEKPTVLVVNRHSLSDAEDFTEGYRALGLGKVVGEPTAGWIVFTWNQPLVDGSVVRLPRAKITTLGGENMERSPRPVDVRVDRPVGEGLSGRDSELDAAVRTLLGQMGGGAR